MSINIINIEAGQKYGRWTVASTGLRNDGIGSGVRLPRGMSSMAMV